MNIIKDSIYHVLFVGLLSAYSVQVCPHASGMGFVILTLNFLVIAAVFFGVRRFVSSSVQRSGKFHIIYDLSHFILIGLLVGLYNYMFREFPVESAYKIVVGALILGFFTSVISTLERPFQVEKKKTSFITTISVFFIVLISLLSVIWILLVVEDIRVFDELLNGSMENFLRDIVIESIFIWGVLLMYVSRIIYLYNRKLYKGISSHIDALQSIAQNNLDVHLDDFSNDEFATIGNEVNSMIQRLREGVKVKESVNKLTSPDIAQKVIDKISQNDFSSEKKEMCILFSDIKGFTHQCENAPPEEFVEKLNLHFKSVVAAVRDHNGTINKFIGDAVLVYFEGKQGALDAFQCARRMIESTEFEIGVGIHHGEVLSGLIGSPDRMEYTIIGSAVNKTARLESATRNLECSIVISSEAYELLPEEDKPMLKSAEIDMKGFSSREKVYFE